MYFDLFKERDQGNACNPYVYIQNTTASVSETILSNGHIKYNLVQEYGYDQNVSKLLSDVSVNNHNRHLYWFYTTRTLAHY